VKVTGSTGNVVREQLESKVSRRFVAQGQRASSGGMAFGHS
jgi:hypothetical protein